MVSLLPKQLIDKKQLGKARRWELTNSILKPAFAGLQEAYLYPNDNNQSASTREPSKWPDFLVPDRRRFSIDCGSELFSEFHREFWIDWNWDRGSLVWNVPEDIEQLSSVFSECYDPIGMENPTVLLNPNAVRLIRSRVTKASGAIWFGLPSGFESLFIFSNGLDIETIFMTALHNCQFTSAFEACYGAA